jgi:hypothetical protein
MSDIGFVEVRGGSMVLQSETRGDIVLLHFQAELSVGVL